MDNLSQLIQLIKQFEGCRLRAYLCPAGVWTVGWGATGTDIGPRTVWSQETADRRLTIDVQMFARSTVALCPNIAGVDASLSALADFAYNLGVGRLRASTLRKKVLAEDWPAAKRELAKWTKGGGRVLPGLVRRRAAEIALLPSS